MKRRKQREERDVVLYEKFNRRGELEERFVRRGNLLIRQSDIYPEICVTIIPADTKEKTDAVCQRLTNHPRFTTEKE